ncbi:hypothetical protein [Parasitella parasitica]|uniref:Alkyl hydroperoxide reductase subunit C/ Thiol specific antioxidant domain-containing protein n=1 Tax=Parasitella parasitica TaxID=35722 RepID=A0A0B7N6F8_9FUNG|nr:hypothetical protein [Parasitella parasitica]
MQQLGAARSSLKRRRGYMDEVAALSEEVNSKLKIANKNKPHAHDFQCLIFYQNQIMQFQLSDAFQAGQYVALFFCGYDLEYYDSFVEYGAMPIAMTQDLAPIHAAYATPNFTSQSLNFEPKFILASDGIDRLISTAFKSLNMQTLEMKRSVVIIDRNLDIVFTHRAPEKGPFSMKEILNCFH